MNRILSLLFLSFFFQKNISAQYVFDSENSVLEKTAIQPPLENQVLPFKNYRVETSQPSTIQHPTGTKIIIPANAFVDANGKVVKGKVDLKFREFNNPLDIYLSGIPMTIDQNGKKEFFQSAGMIELRVSQNEQEVFPNPDSEMINVEITSNQLEDDFQLYNLEESTGEWIEEGKDEVLWNSKNVTNNIATGASDNDFNNQSITNIQRFTPPISPSLNLSHFNFIKLKRDRKKELKRYLRKISKHQQKFQFKLETHKNNSKKLNKKTKQLIKTFPELYELRKMTWFYDGDYKKDAAKFFFHLNRFSRDTISQYNLEDITIHPNYDNDNFDIKFKFIDTIVLISAYPYFSTSNPLSIQKKNQTFYKKYLKKYEKRCLEWKRLEGVYADLNAKYEVELEDYKKRIVDSEIFATLTPEQIAAGVTRRRIRTFTFGVLNIDKVMYQLNEEVLVELIDKNGANVEHDQVVILDQKNNAMLAYNAGKKIKFDSRSKNSLIITLKNGARAIVDSETFKASYEALQKNKMIIEVEILEKENLNKKELSNALASN